MKRLIEQLQKTTTQFLALLFGLPLFTFLVLALAQWGSGSSCHWQFPKWFGCVLGDHDSLAAGLIGATGALFAAWIAWTAVQRQINADRERALADRKEAERLLSQELTDFAEALAAALRRLAALSEDASYDRSVAVYEAAAYMVEHVSRKEPIANSQAMADTLSWDRRIKYGMLPGGLDDCDNLNSPKQYASVIKKLCLSCADLRTPSCSVCQTLLVILRVCFSDRRRPKVSRT